MSPSDPPVPLKKDSNLIEYLTLHAALWTFYVNVAVLVSTGAVLILTVLAIRGPLIENTRGREAEVREKRVNNALDLMRIVDGDDPKTGKEVSGMMQIAAIEGLYDYPEYHDAYVSILSFWKENPKKATNVFVTRAMEELVQKTTVR